MRVQENVLCEGSIKAQDPTKKCARAGKLVSNKNLCLGK